MFHVDPLPTDEQRKRLCEVLHHAFIDLRSLVGSGCSPEVGHQAFRLAWAFHNLPVDMWNPKTWNIQDHRGRLAAYLRDYPGGPDYVAMFDAIFPPSANAESRPPTPNR